MLFMQYRIVLFKQSCMNQCCTRNSFSYCTFQVFKRNADVCEISVLNYVDFRGIGALRYCLVTNAFFLESTKDSFIHFELFIMFVL